MDIERALISKVLLSQDLGPALDAKITPDFFEDAEHAEAFDWIIWYYGKYSKVPPTEDFLHHLVGYELISAEADYIYYLDEIRKRRRYGIAAYAVKEAADILNKDADPDAAINVLSSAVSQVHREVSVLIDENINETWVARVDAYHGLKNLDGKLRGVPTGFSVIDRATSGLQPEQLITYIGLPKSGKSTFLLLNAIAVNDYGLNPLLISFEMSSAEQTARHDAFVAHLDWQKLMNGKLNLKEEERLTRILRERSKLPQFVISTDIASATTVSGFQAKLEQYQPSAAFIDGVYMMDDENGEPKGSAQALTNITRSLKRLAQRFKIPIVISTQVLFSRYSSRKGLTTEGIGYTSSFGQDSDLILGVESDPEDAELVKLSIVTGRNAPRLTTIIHRDWSTGTFTELNDDEDNEDI